MDHSILEVGDKIEMVVKQGKVQLENEGKRVYVSQILDFQEDDLIVAALPIYEEHLIPLEVGSRFKVFFYTKKGIYRSECQVMKRGKEGKIYIAGLMLTERLEKYQRREFYRCPCSVDTDISLLTSIEALTAAKTKTYPENLVQRLEKGIITDISGGGIRLITKNSYEKTSYLYLKFILELEQRVVELEIVGRVILSVRSEKDSALYENRVQFMEISNEYREAIVKYVFEQQRKLRKKERG